MTKYWLSVACLFSLFFTFPAFGRVILSQNQQIVLQKAQRNGRLIGWPQTMGAIVWQESSLGRNKIGDDGKSLGLAHVQVPTARKVLEHNPWLPQFKTNYDIAKMLLYNDDLNLIIASIYFQSCYYQFKNWERAAVCYNAGPNVAKKLTKSQVSRFPYVIKLRERLHQIARLEENHDNQSLAISAIPSANPETMGTTNSLP